MDPDAATRLRDGLLAAGYTVEGVAELLGPVAYGALTRDETVPARRAPSGGTPLETLVRLFLLQLPQPAPAVAAALALPDALDAGLVESDGEAVRSVLDVRPYDDGAYVVSDHGTGLDGVIRPLPRDHVLGVGGASTTLAQLTVRVPVGRALDLGTGSGVQALHLARHSRSVVGTDVARRAVRLAAMTAALSAVEVELREGSLYEPVAGERFDLVVSNPPFVVGAAEPRPYRDSGLPGDEVCRRLVRGAPDHLTDGGWCQLLGNWLHRPGQDWRERVAGWLPAGCDAWVVQREVQDPAEYVALWLRDSGEQGGPGYVRAYDAWLDALGDAEAVGFGWVVLRRTGAAATARIEDWPHPVEQPLGPHVVGHFGRASWLAARDDRALLTARLVLAPDVVQETGGRPGAEHPEYVVLRQRRGMRRAEQVDTATAALAGACDGSVPLGVLADAVAQVLGEPVGPQLLTAVRRLVAGGLLEPAASQP